MAAKSTGGYNVEVLHKPDKERFKCSLCLGIIKMATHGCMNHVFCKQCIDEYIEKNRSKKQLLCPAGCGITFDKDKLQSSKPIDHFINTIACKCPDCNWQGELYDFVQQHELNCEEKKVLCDLCDEFIKRKDVQSHVSETCCNRKVECQYCSKELPYCEHLNHEEICQNTEVDCFYRKFGCTETIKRKSMDLHNEKNNQKHLHLVTKYFLEENKCLQLANKDLQLSNKELVLQNKKLQSENTEIKKLFDEIDKKMQVQNKFLKLEFFKRFTSKEKDSLEKVLKFQGEICFFQRCSLSQRQLKNCFDTKDFLSIAKDITANIHWLEGYEDLLDELISSSSVVSFIHSSPFYMFFKTKVFPKYDQGLIPILNKDNIEIGPLRHPFRYQAYNMLQVSKWDIKLNEKPIDLSQPDERFKLSNHPFTSDCYGFLTLTW